MNRSVSLAALPVLVGLSSICGLAQGSGASNIDLNSVDQIERSFRFPISDAAHIDYPAVLAV